MDTAKKVIDTSEKAVKVAGVAIIGISVITHNPVLAHEGAKLIQ